MTMERRRRLPRSASTRKASTAATSTTNELVNKYGADATVENIFEDPTFEEETLNAIFGPSMAKRHAAEGTPLLQSGQQPPSRNYGDAAGDMKRHGVGGTRLANRRGSEDRRYQALQEAYGGPNAGVDRLLSQAMERRGSTAGRGGATDASNGSAAAPTCRRRDFSVAQSDAPEAEERPSVYHPRRSITIEDLQWGTDGIDLSSLTGVGGGKSMLGGSTAAAAASAASAACGGRAAGARPQTAYDGRRGGSNRRGSSDMLAARRTSLGAGSADVVSSSPCGARAASMRRSSSSSAAGMLTGGGEHGSNPGTPRGAGSTTPRSASLAPRSGIRCGAGGPRSSVSAGQFHLRSDSCSASALAVHAGLRAKGLAGLGKKKGCAYPKCRACSLRVMRS